MQHLFENTAYRIDGFPNADILAARKNHFICLPSPCRIHAFFQYGGHFKALAIQKCNPRR